MRTNERGRSVFLVLIALIGLSLIASLHCTKDIDDEDTANTDPPCQENTGRCDDNLVMLCRMGEWQAWENCAAINGECKSDETSAHCEIIPVEDTDSDTSSQDSDSSTDTEDTTT